MSLKLKMQRAVLAFSLLGSLAGPVLCAPASRDSFEAFERDVDTMMRGYVSKSGWAANLAIVYAGRKIVRGSYGIGDRVWQIPTRPDAVYRVGSTTKMFTAVAILQLIQSGKLAIDASVRNYLPDSPQSWQPITIQNLLSQSSGLAEYSASTNSFRALMRVDRTPDAILALVKDQPLRFIPGSKFEYSNTNYVALGMIIEKVTGKTYADYIGEQVLRPAGMTHSGYFDDTQILPSFVPGYLLTDGGLQNMFHISPNMLYAAGNLYSTIDDLILWDRALHDTDALGLNATLRTRMFQDQGFGYGFGAFVDKIDGEIAVGHGGTLPGYQVGYERFTRVPLTIILMANVYPVDVDKIAGDLARLFFKHCGKIDPARQCDLTSLSFAVAQ
ncbi:serine hydrolase domain-containing protein [Pseudoduganella sp. UC29_106]|uniref:serine hydrolase domain-containing protein n=1 Tax=Pseudoduganella sp. UC29_106 TaxID=3374553 RepID=UPI00375688E4